jgi:hypothetical protein
LLLVNFVPPETWARFGAPFFVSVEVRAEIREATPQASAHSVAPSAAKAAVDFAALTARLKPHPFQTKSKPEFFRSL